MSRGHATLINLVCDVDSRIIGKMEWMRRRVGRGMEIRSQTRARSEINHNGRMGDSVIYRSVAEATRKGCVHTAAKIFSVLSDVSLSGFPADEERTANVWRTDPWEIAFVNETVLLRTECKIAIFLASRTLPPGAAQFAEKIVRKFRKVSRHRVVKQPTPPTSSRLWFRRNFIAA